MILVSGYYGYQNSGDESILATLCQELEDLGIKRDRIIVLSGNPGATRSQHQVTAISRYNLPKIIWIMPKIELLISGGGSLLQDSTSWRTIPYYLGTIELALRFKVPVVMYAQGIGPVKFKPYQRWITRVVNQLAQGSVRDQASYHLLKEWGVTNEDILLASDPVFRLPDSELSPTHSLPGISFNLRPYPGWQKHYSQWCHLIKSWIDEAGWPVYFVPLNPEDLVLGQQLQKSVPTMELREPQDWFDAFRLISRTKVALTMRLHGLIFSAIGGAIPVALAYDPKIQAIGSELGIAVRPPEPNHNLTQVMETIMLDYSTYNLKLQQQVQLMQERASLNQQILSEVISNKPGGS